MLNTNPTVSLGDLVIVYEDYKTMKHVYVKSGGVYHNNFGSFKHDDMVGRPFGHKMASHNGHGFVHLLQPTAELWTASLSHRTQVRPALTVALTLTPMAPPKRPPSPSCSSWVSSWVPASKR